MPKTKARILFVERKEIPKIVTSVDGGTVGLPKKCPIVNQGQMRPCPVSDRPLLFGYRLSAGRGGNIWRREYQMISLIIGGQQPAPPPSISPERRHRRQGSGVSISRLSLLRRHLNVERPEDIASVRAKRGTWKLSRPLHLPPLDQMRQSQRSPYGGGG